MLIRSIAFAWAAAWIASIAPPASAFEYTSYSPSSSDTFRLLDQPAEPSATLGPTAPQPSPTTLSQAPQLSSVTPLPTLETVPVNAPQQPATQTTLYTRVDYFHWNERADGADFADEDGALITLGYEKRMGHERFRAELFGNQVAYHADIFFAPGDIEPLKSVTNYLGVRAEYELLFDPESLPELDFFAGLGTRFWIRDLPDAFTSQGSFVEGYQETWWTIYPYLGVETRQLPQPDLQWYGRGRLGLTAVTYEYVDVFPPATLFPRPGLIGQAEGGIRGQRLFVGAYFEALSWSQSAVSRGWLQPESKMFTVGLKTGLNF